MPRTFPARTVQQSGYRKPESLFRSACLAWLKVRFKGEFWQLKIAGGPYQRSGSPDSICSIRGYLVALEWKDPEAVGKKRLPSPKQAEVIEEIRSAGGRAYCVASWEDLWEAVQGIEPVLDVPLPVKQMRMV